jgi:hypothetical protein
VPKGIVHHLILAGELLLLVLVIGGLDNPFLKGIVHLLLVSFGGRKKTK